MKSPAYQTPSEVPGLPVPYTGFNEHYAGEHGTPLSTRPRSYGRLPPALLPVYTPTSKSKRKKKLASFAGSCLTFIFYIAMAGLLIGAGYALANAGFTLTVNIERKGNANDGQLTRAATHTTHPIEQQQQQLETSPADYLGGLSEPPPTDDVALEQPEDNRQLQEPVAVDPHPDSPSIYTSGMSALDIYGREVKMADLDGSVTLFVNVASQCGYTDSNYKELQRVYERYHEYGLDILAFPCNEFGQQEPKLNFEIEQDMKEKYNVTFTLMSKVSKIQRHPIFSFLRANAPPLPSHDVNEEISWNFNKFLVDKYGHVVKRYPPETVTHQLEIDVYKLLTDSPLDD